ncbi:probable carbohydrate esterase At4g34215 isoform X1 [Solanum lycopersicum]|nr:probable carbohydrate esterase At4g34215 isoform X1 [Solanum lycopersicum]XP_019066851.1 probable carbohydrate esterase At4g34215 isoform X1 [Solanum lycopersicum]XP_025884496.1 probable carbohydrate esterase At4g34215 isoform X1 [Solanum lycopersicum]
MLLAYIFLILLAHPFCVIPTNTTTSNDNKSIFILAGQSNMSGRGGVVNNIFDWYIPPECQSNSSILRLTKGLSWEVAKEPIHQDIDYYAVCGIGPGMSFANFILKNDPNIGLIGLVPCAIGSTNITLWSQGSFCYNQMVNRARIALQDGGTLRALLWYQGESDTLNLDDAESYKSRLEKFFTDARNDLDVPSLPIIQVALATTLGPYMKEIRKAQLRINLPNVKTVDANGLKVGPDYVHLSTQAEAQLGQMMAQAFLEFGSYTIHNSLEVKKKE